MSRNRTTTDSGVRLDGNFQDVIVPQGLGISPAQAVGAAAPLINFLNSLPYTLDETGEAIGYRTNTLALTHESELRFAPGHPNAGERVMAQFSGGDYVTRFGGAPMPFLDLDVIDPFALLQVLKILYAIRDAQINAT